MGATNREGAWTHNGSGDAKADPEICPGINVLPDGNIALTPAFIERRLPATRPEVISLPRVGDSSQQAASA